MNYHIILHQWSGADWEKSVTLLAKVFRIKEEKARAIVTQISNGEAWQFDHIIASRQSGEAEKLLIQLGFDVELVAIPDSDKVAVDPNESSGSKNAGKSERGPKLVQPKRKTSKTAIAVLGLVLAIAGFSQTELGKEYVEKWVIIPLIATSGNYQTVYKPPPGLASSTSNRPAQPGFITGLHGIPFDKSNTSRVSSFKGACMAPGENLRLTLYMLDLENTQSDIQCKDNTIANPIEDWECKYHYEDGCGRSMRPYYNCNRQFTCVPPTAIFNKAIFKQKLENMKNKL